MRFAAGVVVLAGGAVLSSGALADTVKYYGGDAVSALFPSQQGGEYSSVWMFEDFQWDGGAVTRMFGNFYSTTSQIVGMEFEIRSGISEGNGGVLVASGTGSSLWTSIGGEFFRGDLDVTDFNLAAGTYYLALRPILEGAGAIAGIGTSNGTNAVGSSATGEWSLHAPDYGFNYLWGSSILGPLNLSQGIYGVEMVPLPPAAWAGLGTLAGLAGFRVVRRRGR